MLALSLALLLALPAAELPAAGARALQPQPAPPALIPYGTASGSWFAGTLFEDGVLVALLEDAAGRPLFVLDARLTATGDIQGELRTLQYLTNPALGLPPLSVIGEAQLPPVGAGRFSATIFSPLEGPIPVHPFGRIEGLLMRGLRRATKPGLGAGQTTGTSQQPASGHSVSGLIICHKSLASEPFAPIGSGPVGAAGGKGVAPLPPPPESGQATLGSQHTWIGHCAPPTGEGAVRARWYLLP